MERDDQHVNDTSSWEGNVRRGRFFSPYPATSAPYPNGQSSTPASSFVRGVGALDLNSTAEDNLDDMAFMDLLGASSRDLVHGIEDDGGSTVSPLLAVALVVALVVACLLLAKLCLLAVLPLPAVVVVPLPQPFLLKPNHIGLLGQLDRVAVQVHLMHMPPAQKKKDSFDKANWTSFNNNVVFSELCVEQVRAGNRNNGTMTNRGYENIADPFYERTSLRHSVKQLRNRWDQLKSLYTFWTYCNKQSELVKNGTGGIIASDAFWDQHCKKQPERKKLKYGPPECLEDLEVMFEGINVSSEDETSPSEDDTSSSENNSLGSDSDDGLVKVVEQ
nr:unnamed protein product [Digitaria exilis]